MELELPIDWLKQANDVATLRDRYDSQSKRLYMFSRPEVAVEERERFEIRLREQIEPRGLGSIGVLIEVFVPKNGDFNAGSYRRDS
ncbi:hypothetical protein E0I94_30615 [Rhizobium laguerreae]|nr:hypothetical protein E0I94_30615 [Rhizobium laguerreae]